MDERGGPETHRPRVPPEDRGAIYHALKDNEKEGQREREAIQGEQERRPGLLTIPARDFLTRPRVTHPKLIPRLGGRRGGKLAIFGRGGSGKSFTMLNLAVGAAEGRPLLGLAEWAVPHPLRVAFISLEDPAEEQMERLHKMLPFYDLQEAPERLEIFDRDLNEGGLVLAGRKGELNEKAFDRLGDTLGDLAIDLLLIEPKSYLAECDENSNSENGPWQKRFHDLLSKHKTLAILGHHAGWSKDGGSHARGASVFRDWVDGMLRQTEDTIQGRPGFSLHCDKSNFAPQWEPLALLFDPDTGGITAADETLSKIPPAFLRSLFLEHGGAIVDKQEDIFALIAETAHSSIITARRAVEQAVKEGWLKNRGRGQGFGLCERWGNEQ